MNNNNHKYTFGKRIEYVSELQDYVNKPLFFENGSGFMWIKTIKEPITKYQYDYPEMKKINGIPINGTLTAAIITTSKNVGLNFFKNDHTKPTYSNAQIRARTLTEKELKAYKTAIKQFIFPDLIRTQEQEDD